MHPEQYPSALRWGIFFQKLLLEELSGTPTQPTEENKRVDAP